MSEQEAVPTDDVQVRVEDEVQDEVNTDIENQEGDTSKNESSEQSRDEKRNAGHVIADLGNEKKQIASKLVTLAKSNESAREEVKKMLIDDPSTATYLKTKFGTDYDFIVGDEKVEGTPDVERIREEEREKAKVEVIKEQMKLTKERELEAKAKEFKFTSEEYDLYKQKVELLGGDEQAMADAAILVNRSKADAKTGSYVPDSGEAERPVPREVVITSGLDGFSKERHLDRQEFAKDIDRVKRLHRKDEYGKSVMELPKL